MTTTWKIFDTQYQVADGLITKVTYGCTTQLENFIDRKIGELELQGDSLDEGFIPYASVPEETILEWVKSILGQEIVTSIETALQQSVTAKKQAEDNKQFNNGLPWMQEI
jgi:hypothetical protein